MQIVTPNKVVITDYAYFKPYTRYVVTDWEGQMLISKTPTTQWRWSSFNSYERKYFGQDLNGKKVVVYRHDAWGDQLIASSVPAELVRRYPDATIHLYCRQGVLPLWYANPYVGGAAVPVPMLFDTILHGYDYHIFYEGMLENNSEPDQPCCYDYFFTTIGIFDAPPSAKKPCIFPRPEDYRVFKEMNLKTSDYIVYHMSPKNENRCYPPKLAQKMLNLLAKETGKLILVVGVDPDGKYDWIFDGMSSLVVNMLEKTKNFRELIPIVERASLVICPDSAIMHLAACFPNVPIISLWGVFHPDDRAKYYTNNHPIFHPECCPTAPCRDHNFVLPFEQCKDADGSPPKSLIEWCRVLGSITPEEIVEKAKELL
jgi:ADP-heptose:LPS heptosyltransferase